MDRQSERDTPRQWKNWEKERDKELKRERGREGLSFRSQHSGRPVGGGECCRAHGGRLNEQVEYSETERVKASMLPPRKLKARRSAWQRPQLCDATMAELLKKILTTQRTFSVLAANRIGIQDLDAAKNSVWHAAKKTLISLHVCVKCAQ